MNFINSLVFYINGLVSLIDNTSARTTVNFQAEQKTAKTESFSSDWFIKFLKLLNAYKFYL